MIFFQPSAHIEGAQGSMHEYWLFQNVYFGTCLCVYFFPYLFYIGRWIVDSLPFSMPVWVFWRGGGSTLFLKCTCDYTGKSWFSLKWERELLDPCFYIYLKQLKFKTRPFCKSRFRFTALFFTKTLSVKICKIIQFNVNKILITAIDKQM